MKIAIVWNYDSRLLECSFRFEQYVEALMRLGHDPVVVCAADSAMGFEGPLHTEEHLDRLADPAVWRALKAQVAIIVTWHRMPEVLGAIEAAGTRIIALSDTDGRPGNRLYWAHNLHRQILYRSGPRARLRFAAGWLRRQVRERLTRKSWEDQVALLSTRRSDVVVMGHEGGRRNLIRFLRASGAAELAERVVVVPFTIGASFLECQVPARKQDRIVAIGRWNDPQKHARLLARSLEAVLQRRPQTEVEIMGGGGEEYFAALAARWDRLRYSGARRQVEVADSLAASRSIVFSSRWEGCPHAAIEALSLGATVVGTPLPSLASWAQDGRFGRVAAHHTPGSLSGAIEHELSAWDRGERDADAISRHWRDLVRPERVCRELLGSIDL